MHVRLATVILAAMSCSSFVGCASMHGRSAGCGDACGCAAPCGCADTCCDAGNRGCAVPSCCHPSMAGQTWDCCEGDCTPHCYCTGPNGECCHPGCCGWLFRWWYGSGSCGCGDSCGEGGCGCETSSGCEPCCATGCGSDGCGGCCKPVGPCGRLWNSLCGCSGCDCESYWSEWYNDPPRCCDPCDQCGNWIGPSAGSYRAPYAHPYAAHQEPESTYVGEQKQPTIRR
jgi:hypothetical protein